MVHSVGNCETHLNKSAWEGPSEELKFVPVMATQGGCGHRKRSCLPPLSQYVSLLQSFQGHFAQKPLLLSPNQRDELSPSCTEWGSVRLGYLQKHGGSWSQRLWKPVISGRKRCLLASVWSGLDQGAIKVVRPLYERYSWGSGGIDRAGWLCWVSSCQPG